MRVCKETPERQRKLHISLLHENGLVAFLGGFLNISLLSLDPKKVMNEWIYLISLPINRKTDGVQKENKKKHKTLIHLTHTKQKHFCKSLVHRWVLTYIGLDVYISVLKLYRSIRDRIACSGLVILYWRVTYLLHVHGGKCSKNFAYF